MLTTVHHNFICCKFPAGYTAQNNKNWLTIDNAITTIMKKSIRFEVYTYYRDKPKQKVKMQVVMSRKKTSKATFSVGGERCIQTAGRCYIFRQGVPGLWASNR